MQLRSGSRFTRTHNNRIIRRRRRSHFLFVVHQKNQYGTRFIFGIDPDKIDLEPEQYVRSEVLLWWQDHKRLHGTANEGTSGHLIANTNFYDQLLKGYDKVQKWIKTDLFNKRAFLVPVNFANHWTLIIVELREKTISFYDSIGGSNKKAVKITKNFLVKERTTKHPLRAKIHWEKVSKTNGPRQNPDNLIDCGVHICTMARAVAERRTSGPWDSPTRQRQVIAYQLLSPN